jgi:hypothetical protein
MDAAPANRQTPSGRGRIKGVRERMITVVAGRWYVDASEGHRGVPIENKFKVLGVHPETLDVIEEGGERRIVNRLIFEEQCRPLREPVAR